jgi:cell division septum initiation protein DivIVA
MWSWEAVVGTIIAVITAGMPAMLALLKIKELHVLINSRLSELIEATAKASHSAGQLEGRDEGRKAAEVESAIIIQDASDLAKKLLAEAAEKARVLLVEAAEKGRVLLAEAANEAQKQQKES